ncbi:hypothetical protein Clow_02148 [Corynebacterium lowii]|uniref:Uncharacterized protein n=2 Tax=Corynebacterium lowii TaxID=1544413 RepID=A0A0Q0YCK7_9CORY|nr:hypothetical protein Clow_02148 [Corynebacterium lowii]
MRLTSEEEIASRNLIASLHQLELGKWEEPQGLLPLNPTSLERISALRKSGKAPTMEDKVAVVAPALGGDESKAKAMILAWENPA